MGPLRLFVMISCWATVFTSLQLFAPVCQAGDQQGLELFEKAIRPVLIRYCYECHSSVAKELKGGLRLDSRDGIRQGGDTGPAVVPGNVRESLLIEAMRHESLEMPPDEKLPHNVTVDFVKWIELGAPDPRDSPPAPDEVAEVSWQLILESRRNWWSLQQVQMPEIPEPTDTAWSEHPVDRFIRAKQEDSGLQPAQDAEAHVLMRRLSLILTGLPPTPAEIAEFETFLTQSSSDGYERVVDHLLKSPHFGERWARHWMDIVRFAETHGYEWNHEIRDAWQYRDYLIRAFNNDVPYNQMIREHIAGDLINSPRINEELNINESVIGTAFWRFGELGHDDCVQFPEIRFDALDNQIDTFTKAFQAITVSCARCHDHKFDPISTRDYYALAGILESSRQIVQTIDTPNRINDRVDRLKSIKSRIHKLIAEEWLSSLNDVDDFLLATLQSDLTSDSNTDEATAPLVKQLACDEIAMEDPGAILRQIVCLQSETEVRPVWQAAHRTYEKEQSKRAKSNEKNFEPWLWFGEGEQPGWSTAGLGPGHEPLPSGEFVLNLTGDKAVTNLLPSGIYTHLFSSRLNGTVQSPWMPGDRKFVSIQILGGGLSMARAVVDSCALNEYVGGGLEYLSDDKIQWLTFPTRVDASHRAFLELTTKSDNVRWPDRPGVAGKDEALLESPRSWFGIVKAVLHDGEETPQPELSHLLSLFEQPDPATFSEVAQAYRVVCLNAVQDWKDGTASDDDVRWINWMLSIGVLKNTTQMNSGLERLVHEYRKAESDVPLPRVVAGMADQGSGFASPVLIRGNPLQRGTLEPRRYLEIITGSRTPIPTRGSGRRELAELIASPTNPLTARVMVNRVWHHLFGSGLVRTPDDFGRLGDQPSHPDLLDFLAADFVHNGWSVKSLIRQIVTSRTFRQSSVTKASFQEIDPENRLVHHFPVRRLEAEAIRDTILAVSERLDRKQFGPGIQPFRAEPKEHRKLYAGPVDGHGRRSVYLKVTRMEGPRFLELFDLPDQTATRGRRDRTNVPAQALALLNDPFVIDQSRVWGQALAARHDESSAIRVDYIFLKAMARAPNAAERNRMLGFVDQLAQLHGVKPVDILSSQDIWQDVAHAVLNMKELVYVQ